MSGRRSPANGTDTGFNTALHGLRGIASLMVFAAHLIGGAARHIYETDVGYISAITPWWNFGTFGVEIFFVISGFVILPSAMRYDIREFAARRFMRLYPLFFALSILFIALNAATDLYPKLNTGQAIVAGLTFTDIFAGTEQLTPNAWSLTYEVWFYVLTAAGVSVLLRHCSKLAVLLLAVAAGAFVARFPISLYFVTGLAIRCLYDRHPSICNGRHPVLEMLLIVAVISLGSRGHYEYDWQDFRNPVVPLLLAATALYFLLAVSAQSLTAKALGRPVFLYLGTVSYSLYLVHPYTYYAVRGLLDRHGVFTDDIALSMTQFFVLTGVTTLVLTHVVHRTLERWPYEWVYRQAIYRDKGPRRSLRLPWRPVVKPVAPATATRQPLP